MNHVEEAEIARPSTPPMPPGSRLEGEQGDDGDGPIRVLLAEDHVLVRAGICALLQSLDGIEVLAQASNGHEALRLLGERADIDIAILDISMDGMNGLQAAAHIARLHPRTRTIMLSMHDAEEYVRQALRAGASGYLLKDSGFNELEIAVRAVARGETYLSPSVSRQLITDYLRQFNDGSLGDDAAEAQVLTPQPTQRMPAAALGAPLGEFPAEAQNAEAGPGQKASDDKTGGEIALTPRQTEILRLLTKGLSNGQMAKELSISIKTVETHRQQLMIRLGIFEVAGLVRYAMRHGLAEPL